MILDVLWNCRFCFRFFFFYLNSSKQLSTFQFLCLTVTPAHRSTSSSNTTTNKQTHITRIAWNAYHLRKCFIYFVYFVLIFCSRFYFIHLFPLTSCLRYDTVQNDRHTHRHSQTNQQMCACNCRFSVHNARLTFVVFLQSWHTLKHTHFDSLTHSLAHSDYVKVMKRLHV